MVQIQPHEAVARLQHGQQHGCVGLCARVGLHVGILGIKQLADALDGQFLHFVHHLAAAIVALARITLGILVGQVGAHSLHHLVAHEVLTGNQLDAFQLTLMLFLDQLENSVVSFHFFCSVFYLGWLFLLSCLKNSCKVTAFFMNHTNSCEQSAVNKCKNVKTPPFFIYLCTRFKPN